MPKTPASSTDIAKEITSLKLAYWFDRYMPNPEPPDDTVPETEYDRRIRRMFIGYV